MKIEVMVPWDNNVDQLELFGSSNHNINYIESKFDVSVHLRGGALKITGEEAAAQKAADAIEALRDNIRNNQKIENQGLHYICDMIEQNKYVK
jgi:phosphate starvation-inducible protein PhoH